jgi:hypothetical protein
LFFFIFLLHWVAGNGPSAITLSFMLAGHWPYYNGNPVADPCLQSRLEDTRDHTLMESNLEELSEVMYRDLILIPRILFTLQFNNSPT